MRGGPTFDEERFSVNVARLKKGGETFEVVIDPDAAVRYKQGEISDLKDVLKAEKIMADAKKGELASEAHMQSLFGTSEPTKVAQIILDQGELQLTHEHRERLREQKRNKVASIIHMNAINPQTGIVHPLERVKRAMDEARVRLDEYKSAQDQVQDVVRALQPILPIKFTTFIAEIHLPATHAAKCYGVFEQYGTLQKEDWLSDGSLAVKLEVPAGRYNDLVDELSSKTHGDVEISKQERK